MARTRGQQRARAANVDPWGPTRAEKRGLTLKPPTQRSLRGAQMIARHDMERGVTSRPRKSLQGTERVPDPSAGGRPGRRRSKFGRKGST